jgi:hypothetical protein
VNISAPNRAQELENAIFIGHFYDSGVKFRLPSLMSIKQISAAAV